MRSLCLSVLVATAAFAQAPDLKTLSGGAKALQNQMKGAILRSAEKMAEGDYSFAPTAGVRTFGQMLGHVADSQYPFCAAVLGEKPPQPGVEKNMKTKEALIGALKEAFAYCDKAFDSVTDANAAEVVSFFGGQRTKLNVLSFNTGHNFEHYGNLVTYLRMKGIVPPSSERRQ